MPSLAISAPVSRDTLDLAVTKKSHVLQMSNRGRISGWQNGQIRSPYSRLIMGVSSFTKPRLPGLFSWPGTRTPGLSVPRGRRTAPPKRLRLRLRPTRQCGRAFLREGILAALDAEKPAVDVAQQNLRRFRYGGFVLGGGCGAAPQPRPPPARPPAGT